MSATSGHNCVHARSFTAARQGMLQRILRQYGVLSRHSLCELAHADRWTVPFDTVLARATRSGRVRRLSGDLYEAGEDPGDD